MNEQELRAFALLIAELNHYSRFFNIRDDKIELNNRHLNYLNAIKKFIENGDYLEISDNGTPSFPELR